MRFLLTAFLPSLLIVFFLNSCFDTDSDALSFQEQLTQDTTAIGSYLRSRNLTSIKDASGVSVVIESLGKKFPPRFTSTAIVSYKGTLLTGETFDQGTNVRFEVDDLISGFQIGLTLLPQGSKGKIFIPSVYGYGNQQFSGIPANSNLIFEVTVVDVVASTEEKQRLGTDTVAIDTYLAQNSINAIKDTTGLRYVINQVGTGAKPGWYDKVKLSYTGKLLPGGAVFFTGTSQSSSSFDSRVINYIHGFQAGLPKLAVGGKATFFVPSGLGFGNRATQGTNITVPANSNLIFEMELVAIE